MAVFSSRGIWLLSNVNPLPEHSPHPPHPHWTSPMGDGVFRQRIVRFDHSLMSIHGDHIRLTPYCFYPRIVLPSNIKSVIRIWRTKLKYWEGRGGEGVEAQPSENSWFEASKNHFITKRKKVSNKLSVNLTTIIQVPTTNSPSPWIKK